MVNLRNESNYLGNLFYLHVGDLVLLPLVPLGLVLQQLQPRSDKGVVVATVVLQAAPVKSTHTN